MLLEELGHGHVKAEVMQKGLKVVVVGRGEADVDQGERHVEGMGLGIGVWRRSEPLR